MFTDFRRLSLPDGHGEITFSTFRLTHEWLTVRALARRWRLPRCPGCHDLLAMGQAVTFVQTEPFDTPFPSILLHRACVDWDDLAATVTYLQEDWAVAQRYQCWF